MSAWRGVGVGLVVLGVCPVRSASAEDVVAAPPAVQGMQVHVDPSTGRRVPEPVTPVPPAIPAVRPRLAEVPAPGGGMMIRLDGRFMNTLVATVDEQGKVHLGCVTEDDATVRPHD
jgi:hypothetical protein